MDRGWAQDPQASLQRQNERLQLLLNLTSGITSNLDLREVLRAISANFRELALRWSRDLVLFKNSILLKSFIKNDRWVVLTKGLCPAKC